MPVPKSRRKTRMAAAARRGGREIGRNKKTLLLDQQLLDRARLTLGARTETDAVTQALEAVVRRGQQVEGIRALAALRSFDPARID